MKFFIYRLAFLILFSLLLGLIIALARGYRINFSQQKVEPTGILVASSAPDGAKVLINGELKGATNSSIGIRPGIYDIEIAQDGYLSWKKKLTIKGELVIKADALLFPINPSLSPVTSFGVAKAFASPTHQRVIILSETGDSKRDGLYLLDNRNNPLARINSQKLLIAKSYFPADISFSNATIDFSPDEKQILMYVYNPSLPTPNIEPTIRAIYLLSTDEPSLNPFEVTTSVEAIKEAWNQEQLIVQEKIVETFKKPIAKVARNFSILGVSPDETKMLYVATESATLPLVITPPLIAANQTPEERELKPGSLYIYDKKEDKNFKIAPTYSPDMNVFWYVDSQHVVIREEDGIAVVDYDSTNKRLVYSGPFLPEFISISPDGKLLILTNFNSSSRALPDVYAVGIR